MSIFYLPLHYHCRVLNFYLPLHYYCKVFCLFVFAFVFCFVLLFVFVFCFWFFVVVFLFCFVFCFVLFCSLFFNFFFWLTQYVNDTCVILKKDQAADFTSHISQTDPNIKFTMEPIKGWQNALLAHWNFSVPDGSLKLKVYRKPTHTDQYLNFKSHHPLEHK